MKYVLSILLSLVVLSTISAQNKGNEFQFGKDAIATIILIDNELSVAKDKTNSILRFEIMNNSSFPIYIAQPELVNGTVPQYFDLHSESIDCELAFIDMITRSSSEFILIPAKNSKEFELHSEFFQNSCLRYNTPTNAKLVYRAFTSKEEDNFIADDLIKRDRASRDIVEYILTTKLKSAPIKISYK